MKGRCFMRPDPAAEVLLSMAEKDFVTVGKMAADVEFADEVFGFHAQQAAEKAAKAMLAAKGVLFERTHDLETLFDALEENGCIAGEAFSGLIDLTDFAVQYRYQAFDEIDVGLDRDAVTDEVSRFLERARETVRNISNSGRTGE